MNICKGLSVPRTEVTLRCVGIVSSLASFLLQNELLVFVARLIGVGCLIDRLHLLWVLKADGPVLGSHTLKTRDASHRVRFFLQVRIYVCVQESVSAHVQ